MEEAMKHDLHLRYKFTDRGGNEVYEKYTDADRIEQKNPLGQLRLTPHGTTNIGLPPYTKTNISPELKKHDLSSNGKICWRNHVGVVCHCEDCEPTGGGTG
jgi:hypothetical protein